MLSDPEGKLAAAFGFKLRARKTVVIGQDGKVEKLIEQVNAKAHPAELLKELGGK